MPSVLYTGTGPLTFERPEGALHLWPGTRYDVDTATLAAMQTKGVSLLVYPEDPPFVAVPSSPSQPATIEEPFTDVSLPETYFDTATPPRAEPSPQSATPTPRRRR